MPARSPSECPLDHSECALDRPANARSITANARSIAQRMRARSQRLSASVLAGSVMTARIPVRVLAVRQLLWPTRNVRHARPVAAAEVETQRERTIPAGRGMPAERFLRHRGLVAL